MLLGSTLEVEAGGGGGAADTGQGGGNGGTPNGTAGAGFGEFGGYAYGGAGGTQSAGGAGGSYTLPSPSTGWSGANGGNGSLGGPVASTSQPNGGQGLAVSDYGLGGNTVATGAGGGGYAGGGGGALVLANGSTDPFGWGGGGGGSSYVASSATHVSYSNQLTAANGAVTITYTPPVLGDIFTVAGSASGASGYTGDGGPATSALLSGPSDVAVDNAGDVYIADSANNRVQEVAGSAGMQWGQWMNIADIYTVAGSSTGAPGSSGDTGAAASGLLTSPGGLALDASDDIYIADTGNNRVQEVASTTGTQWGQSMSQGDIYTVSGSALGAPGYSGDGGPGTSALMYQPAGVAVDSLGDLYFADSYDHVVREVLGYANILVPGGPTQPKESVGGTNPSEPTDPQPSFTSGDVRGTGLSVNAATGELDVNVEDFSVPGRGVPLDLTRTYSSTQAMAAGSPGPFGYGWTDSYAMKAVPDPTYGSSVMDIVQDNGSVVRFLQTATGTWAAAQRVQATLSLQNGNWVFDRGGTEIFTFNPSGQLVSESDLNGYTTTLTYSGGQLTTVTDPAVRALHFYYSGGLVSSVTDPAGRTTSYYYDGYGNLSKVVDAGGGTTIYGYNNPASHLLTSVLDPDAYANGWAATAEQYNSAGQVTLQTDPLGRTTQWSEALDPSGSGTVTITDARANVTQEILADGEPTAITAGYGSSSTTTTTYSYFPNTDPSETVTTASGTPYAETTTYTYNSEDDLISKSAPAPVATGTWTWAYNRLNEVTYAQTPLEAAASAASGTNVATTHLYDASGNILSSSVPLPVPGTDTPSSTDATTVYGYGTGCSTSGANGCYTGDVQSVTDPDGNVTAYTYDVYGDETQVTTAYGTSSAATSYYNYADAIGEVTSSQTPREHAAGVSATYTYDNYGDLVSERCPSRAGGLPPPRRATTTWAKWPARSSPTRSPPACPARRRGAPG